MTKKFWSVLVGVYAVGFVVALLSYFAIDKQECYKANGFFAALLGICENVTAAETVYGVSRDQTNIYLSSIIWPIKVITHITSSPTTNMLDMSESNKIKVRQLAASMVDSVNSMAGSSVDADTIVVGANITENTITFNYLISSRAFDAMTNEQFSDQMFDLKWQQFCGNGSDQIGKMIRLVLSAGYSFQIKIDSETESAFRVYETCDLT